jgi:hypothetical protein
VNGNRMCHVVPHQDATNRIDRKVWIRVSELPLSSTSHIHALTYVISTKAICIQIISDAVIPEDMPSMFTASDIVFANQ